MRMNRENPNNPNIMVKNHCANYNTGYTCSGIMIDRQLNQRIDSELCGKKCLISDNKECDYFDLNVNYKNNLKTQVRVSVFIEKNRNFKKPLEFEKENYFVKENSGKNLTVFAKYPGFIDTKKIKLTISNSNQKAVTSSSEIILNYIEGTNYLKGVLKVKGLKLQDSSIISVNHESTSSSAVVNVMKEKDDSGTEYMPKYVTHFLGSNVRAAWKPQEENILEITTDHPLVRYYLGAKEPINGKFPNFKTPQWKMFFNDILSHAFAEKMVAMNCSQKPETYETLASIIIFLESGRCNTTSGITREPSSR